MAIQVSHENVIGRDALIERIWRKLKTESLRFAAERRIGKTTVMTKMEEEPKEGFKLIFMDLEAIDSVERFVESLVFKLMPLFSGKDTRSTKFKELITNLGGTEIAGVIKFPKIHERGWQVTLEKAIEGVCEHNSNDIIVLLLDEMPYMLQKIEACSEKNGQNAQAITILDTLRHFRQRFSNLRMVYSGSVGLHHVVSILKESGLSSEPVNDMPAVEIHALEHPDAMKLARRLVKEEEINLEEDEDYILTRLVERTDRVPFYIERVVSRLGEMDRTISVVDVNITISKYLTDDLDPWEMEHFRSRLKDYYRGIIQDTNGVNVNNHDIARKILDHFALAQDPQSIDQVFGIVKSNFPLNDRGFIITMLSSLAKDHYLISDEKKRYRFRFPLVREWWVLAQGLEA